MRTQTSRALVLCITLLSSVPPTSALGVNHAVGVEARGVATPLFTRSDYTLAKTVQLARQRPLPDDLNGGRSLNQESESGLSVVTTHDTEGTPIEGNGFYRSRQEAVALAISELPSGPASSILGAESLDNEFSRFGAAFTEAKVPDCLHKDGLKRQPPRILFFAFQGVLAFPFVALAKVRGKCL